MPAEICVPALEVYELTFSRGSQVLLTVWVDAGHCGDVTMERPDPTAIITRRTTPAFWAELSQVLGIPQSVLLPAY